MARPPGRLRTFGPTAWRSVKTDAGFLGAVGPIWLAPGVQAISIQSTAYSFPAGRPAGVASTLLMGRTYAFDFEVCWLPRAVPAWNPTWHT